MTVRIAAPGIYTDMASAAYFADPCPDPSLTQSIAKVLLERSPRHAWTAHPRLNPNWEADDPTKYDVGNIAHRLLLGRGKELEIIDADDWRTKAAKEAREVAAEKGRLGVLSRDHEIAIRMTDVAGRWLHDQGFGDVPTGGDSEAVLAWSEDGVWFRAMVDWLSAGRRVIVDYKTTKASAAPHAIPIKMVTDGWDVQAAMHERGLNVLDPKNAGRRSHFFICQEAEEPFALSVAKLPESALTMGRKKLDAATAIWTACRDADRWPGYPAEVLIPAYPEHLERRWLDREASGHLSAPIAPAELHDVGGNPLSIISAG